MFQHQVLRYAELTGWRAYHTYDSRRSAAGFPDLVLVRRPRVIFAELKGARTPIRDDQRDWLGALQDCGSVEVYCWRPRNWEAIERILR